MTEKDIIICGHGSGNPSTKNMYTYLEKRFNSVASNGVRKGLVAVMRLKALTDDGRAKFHNKYATIIGRNSYNQSLRDYVYVPHNGKYYSDCSSSGMATLKAIGYNVSLLNTVGIYQSSLFEKVPVVIKNGHVSNPEILKVGDCLLFAGNDPSRPKQIGHVEYVYELPKVTTSSPVIKSTKTPLKCDSNIRAIQLYLNTYYGEYIKNTVGELLRVDGSFGTKTKKALATAFQVELVNLSVNIAIDGSFGSKTQSAFTKKIGTLNKADNSIFVTLWQCVLVCLGYNPNGIDGKFGNGCVTATNAFFKAKKVSQDSSVSSADIKLAL